MVRCFGFASWPDLTHGRREVKRLTGESVVPVLVLDDGAVVAESASIAAWARAHPSGD